MGHSLPAAFSGWLLAGPVAIGVLAEFTRVDTQRRANAVYSAPRWSHLYWAVLGVCLLVSPSALAYRDLGGRL
ncbi:putative membrane protein [Mycobacterium kansasii]|uniref:Putative membrane protein n=1 Tax=Mycobacterium kansasii TaxID=1768 RepID=A0A1V3W9T0_MYCKA|nr:putative membrane protein [Mycobacterium kansasii]